MDKDSNKKLYLAGLFLLGIMHQELNGFYNPILIKKPLCFWTVDILGLAILPAVIYFWGRRQNLFSNRELGFHFDVWGKAKFDRFILAMIVMPLLFSVGFTAFLNLGFDLLGGRFEGPVFSYNWTLHGRGALRTTQAVYYALTAGLVEEFYYRGLFRLLFKNTALHLVLYVLLSAAIFSSVHWEGGAAKLFATFVLGLLAAGAYLYLKNLWPLVFGHFLADLFFFS